VNVVMASSAGAVGRPNEDFVGAVPGAVVLLDGAGISGIESICRHGTAWYTHGLGGALLSRLSRNDGRELASILGGSIDQMTQQHRDTCDITNPSSPQATVMIFRVTADRADYLALGDSFLILDRMGDEEQVITDEREVAVRRLCRATFAGVAEGTDEDERAREAYIEMLRARRNQPSGYWIAKDDPHAAQQAVTGRVRIRDLRGAALLSNGASRIVSPYRLADWGEVLDMLRASGPAEVIGRVRSAEASQPGTVLRSGSQAPDDATIAYCFGFLGETRDADRVRSR
jgi:hypothetical protein